MKAKILKHYGGTIAEASRLIGIKRNRITAWPDQLTQLQIDCLVGALYRQGKTIPDFLLE
jgi:hypothetical protein